MNLRTTCLTLALSYLALGGVAGAAPPTTAPTDPASDRLTFLTLQLSSVEESIKAVTAGMKAAGYKANVAADKAEGYEKSNELMDRKGGAPVPWDQFYGKTAKAFSAPTATGNYHAEGNGRRVDEKVETGIHPIARPKQFEYLYKANNEQAARAKEEVAKMGQRVDALLARRRKLEGEQSALWATVALESIQNLDIPFKPIYHWRLKPPATQPAAVPAINEARAGTVRALAFFLRKADQAAARSAEAVGAEQERTLASLKDTIQVAQGVAQEDAFRASQSAELNSADLQEIREALAITKRMTALCKNMTESYKLALEGDAAQDEPRKLTFRAKLQESLLAFADATAELDAAISKMASGWGIRGEVGVDSPDKIGAAPNPTTMAPPTTAAASQAPIAPSVLPQPAPPPKNVLTDSSNAKPYRFASIPAPAAAAKRTFDANEVLAADMTFTAAGGPYEIRPKIKITVGRGKRATISAGPGAEVRGGEIEINGGMAVELNGDADNPAIFRHVVFNSWKDGELRARYVIFDQCEFKKVGGYFRPEGLGTKWTFEKCLLNECNWPEDFTWLDYGVKFVGTTFVGMKVGELEGHLPKGKPREDMSYLRTDWRTIRQCAFESCNVPQSVFWCSESSNFVKCRFRIRAAFESDKPTEVSAYVADTQGETPDQLLAEKPPKRAPITIKYALQPLPVFSFPALPGSAGSTSSAPPSMTPSSPSSPPKQPEPQQPKSIFEEGPKKSLTSSEAPNASAAQPPITSVAQLVKLVPDELWPQLSDPWTDARVAAVNAALNDNVNGKVVTITVVFQSVVTHDPSLKDNPNMIAIQGKEETIGKLRVWHWHYIDKDKRNLLSRFHSGDKITLKGKVIAKVQGGNSHPLLVKIQDVEIVP